MLLAAYRRVISFLKSNLTYLLLTALVIFALPAPHAHGCFGPKLYIGVDDSSRQQALYALVSIYLKEKTGTESQQVRVDIDTALKSLTADKADLLLLDRDIAAAPLVFEPSGVPRIYSGERPQSDLQFTLVLPALKKLSGLLRGDDFSALVALVEEGAPPLASARAFMNQRGWL